MKQVLSILLALCLIVCLGACGGTAESAAAQSDSEPALEASEPASPEAASPAAEPAEAEVSAEEAEESSAPDDQAEEIEAQSFEIPMPLTEEPVTFTFFMRFNPQVQDWCQDMSDNLFYSTLEEMSNVHIEFKLFHPMSVGEQFNLEMASGDYSDMYCEIGSNYVGGFDKAVDDEVFLDLTPYMEEYAPNYSAIMNSSDQNHRDAITDEGRVVFFAAAYDQGQQCGKGPMIRADWAEEFGMDPAEINTYAEYEDYIRQAYDTYGATVQLSMDGTGTFGYLTSGYDTAVGFGNAFEATMPFFQIDGQLKSGILTDGFKEYTEMVADWYQKGWIFKDFMNNDFGMQGGADIGMVTDGSSSLWWAENNYMEMYNTSAQDPNFSIAAIQDAVKNEGDVTHLGQTNHESLSTVSNIVITTACKEPEICIQWLDYRYTEEGKILGNWGVEGITFEYDENGNPHYTDLIVNNPEGMTATLAQFRYMLQNTVCLTDISAKNEGMTEQQLTAPEIWMTDKDNSWGLPSTLTMTTEESEQYNPIASDIITYGQEHFLKYITGDEPVSALDDFIETCKSMGLEECVAIRQASLDRYFER